MENTKGKRNEKMIIQISIFKKRCESFSILSKCRVRWKALSATQKQKVKAAADAAAQFNNENRIKEEAQLVDFFKQQGLTVTTPDVDAFRKHAVESPEFAAIAPSNEFRAVLQTESKRAESKCSGGSSCAGCPMADETTLRPHDVMRMVARGQVDRLADADGL